MADPSKESSSDTTVNATSTSSADSAEVLQTMEVRTAARMPRIGDVIAGRYRIERILGTGGMGVVVEARHTALGELVAIKFLRNDARKDNATSERFLREARAASRLKSEHVVRVHDLGTTEDGHAYLVMEHLSGVDLSTELANSGALSVARTVDYVMQACEGLAEAHAMGIVHRDLKPSNLFLTQRPDRTPLIKILDFGIAKAQDQAGDSPTLTDTHSVFGSPAYMSPEQIRSAKSVDGRTDIWSLGVVMFELLARTLPFNGESSSAVLAAVAADPPRSLTDLRPDVPAELANVIGRCLAKDPAKRIQSVLDLVTALAPFGDNHASTSVERIRRLASLPPGAPSNPALWSSPAPNKSSGVTGRAWSTTSPSPRWGGNRIGLLQRAAVAVVILGLSGAVAYFAFAKRPDIAPASSASAGGSESPLALVANPATTTAATPNASASASKANAAAPAARAAAEGPHIRHDAVDSGASTVHETTAPPRVRTAPAKSPPPTNRDPLKSKAALDMH